MGRRPARCEPADARGGRLATAVSEDLQSALEKLSRAAKVKRYVSDARKAIGSIPVELGGIGTELPVGAEKKRERVLEDRLGDALIKVGEVASEADRGVAFLYDEAHLLVDREKEAQFPLSALLAAFVSAQDGDDPPLPIMLAMSGLPPLITNLQAARSHSERLFQVAEALESLSLEPSERGVSPAADALIKPAAGTGFSYDPATAEAIAQEVKGYPYFIQKYGEALWEAAEEAQVANIDDALFKVTKPQVQDALDLEFFDGRYDEMAAAEKLTLRIAASLGGEDFTTNELIAEYETLKPNAVHQSIKRLADNNLIYRIQQGRYGYTAPLFGDYLVRKWPRQAEDK